MISSVRAPYTPKNIQKLHLLSSLQFAVCSLQLAAKAKQLVESLNSLCLLYGDFSRTTCNFNCNLQNHWLEKQQIIQHGVLLWCFQHHNIHNRITIYIISFSYYTRIKYIYLSWMLFNTRYYEWWIAIIYFVFSAANRFTLKKLWIIRFQLFKRIKFIVSINKVVASVFQETN